MKNEKLPLKVALEVRAKHPNIQNSLQIWNSTPDL